MSGESNPILSGAIPAFEMFMTSWETIRDKNPQLASWVDIGLHWATKYYGRMDRTRAYIIAMCKSSMVCSCRRAERFPLQFSIRLCACLGFASSGTGTILMMRKIKSRILYVSATSGPSS
jgi:hypothetical protein